MRPVLNTIRYIFSLFASHSPFGTLSVRDVLKAIASYLLHSGAILAVLNWLIVDASSIANPILAALAIGLLKLGRDVFKMLVSGPSRAGAAK